VHLQPLLIIGDHWGSLCGRIALRVNKLGIIICFIWINEEKVVASKCKDRHGKSEKEPAEL